MTVIQLAARRKTPRVAGARRRPPPPQPEIQPGDLGVMVDDLRQVRGMVEEVLAEALAHGDDGIIASVGALILHVSDVVVTIERAQEGG